jgi:hypothetical protein
MLIKKTTYRLVSVIVLFALPIASLTHAGQEEYDACLLKHLKGAKQDVATHLIIQACDENYKNPSFTSEKRKAYNDCLLNHLVGVESLTAVMEIQSVCGRINR